MNKQNIIETMRILIIEDEKNLADNIRTGLVDEKFVVDVIDNGREAYERAATEEYDAIIMDVQLPEMDGFEICKRLREEKNYTPIIMLTAKDTISDRIAGLDYGADDYMIKPFSFEELLARIRSLVRRAGIKDPILRLDSLELNPSSHVVTRRGIPVNLTGKEYSLLEYFMHHPGQILTREQIVSHVWDYSEDIYSNVIEVMMKRLRQKIDKSFPQESSLFSTVRGLGYKIG